jgi:hypothetical protein
MRHIYNNIYCWGHPLLYTLRGSVAVWMLLSGNFQQSAMPEMLLMPLRLSQKQWLFVWGVEWLYRRRIRSQYGNDN